jgi:ubiquinone/menaquinone biosynthesis C-methylase UbiE
MRTDRRAAQPGAGASAWSGEGFAEPTPRLYDAIMWPAERLLLRRWRRRLYGAIVADAGGAGLRVLEIGAGTGVGFAFYPAGITVTAVEPSVAMAARARERAGRAAATIEVVEARVEELPFTDGSFDCAIATLAWCSVADPLAAFAEVRRVLRPRGRLLLLEHVHSRWQPARRLQSLAAPTWRRVAQGCRLDQDTVGLLSAAGFAVERRRDHLLGWVVELQARRAG